MEMVEKIARAMQDELALGGRRLPLRTPYRQMALAALKAMREPAGGQERDTTGVTAQRDGTPRQTMSARDTAPDMDGTIVIRGDLDAILRSLLSERSELQTRVKALEAWIEQIAVDERIPPWITSEARALLGGTKT